MNSIIIIVIVIIVCVLIFWLWKYCQTNKNNYIPMKITGGEGSQIIGYKDKDTRILSFSEQVISEMNDSGTTPLINSFDYGYFKDFTGQSLGKFKNYSNAYYGNESYIIMKNTEPKLFSDALLDGVNILRKINEIQYVVTMNEFPSIKLIYPELPNVLGKNKNFDADDELNLINFLEDKTLINRKIDFQQILNAKSGNNKMHFIENDFGGNVVHFHDNLDHHLFNNNMDKQIFIFIEFSYNNFIGKNKFQIHPLYLQIHSHTLKLLKRIINYPFKQSLYVFRFVIDDNKFIDPSGIVFNYFEVEQVDVPKIIGTTEISYYIENFDNSNKSYPINIPDTTISFDMDEYLMINYENLNFHVQIEHSENLSKHKSNLVEFLIRSFNLLNYSSSDLLKFLKHINYDLKNLNTSISKFSPFFIANHSLPSMNTSSID